MYDWMTAEFLVMYDSFTQGVLIVGGAMLGALAAPELMGVASWF